LVFIASARYGVKSGNPGVQLGSLL
jgi:hypothetical protein